MLTTHSYNIHLEHFRCDRCRRYYAVEEKSSAACPNCAHASRVEQVAELAGLRDKMYLKARIASRREAALKGHIARLKKKVGVAS